MIGSSSSAAVSQPHASGLIALLGVVDGKERRCHRVSEDGEEKQYYLLLGHDEEGEEEGETTFNQVFTDTCGRPELAAMRLVRSGHLKDANLSELPTIGSIKGYASAPCRDLTEDEVERFKTALVRAVRS